MRYCCDLETRFALDCWRRKTELEKRFRKARIAEGRVRYTLFVLQFVDANVFLTLVKRVAPDTQAYILARDVLETEKQQLAVLQAEYKSSKAELDKIEKEKREKRAAAAASVLLYAARISEPLPSLTIASDTPWFISPLNCSDTDPLAILAPSRSPSRSVSHTSSGAPPSTRTCSRRISTMLAASRKPRGR